MKRLLRHILSSDRSGELSTKKKWKHRCLTILACVVVFATTYSLILPAITIDQNSAKEEEGFFLNRKADADSTTAMPAQEFYSNADFLKDYSVKAEAPEGALPAGAVMTVTPLADETDPEQAYWLDLFADSVKKHILAVRNPENLQAAEEDMAAADQMIAERMPAYQGQTVARNLNGTYTAIQAFSLTFTDANGNTVAPLKNVKITILSGNITPGQTWVTADSRAEEIASSTADIALAHIVRTSEADNTYEALFARDPNSNSPAAASVSMPAEMDVNKQEITFAQDVFGQSDPTAEVCPYYALIMTETPQTENLDKETAVLTDPAAGSDAENSGSAAGDEYRMYAQGNGCTVTVSYTDEAGIPEGSTVEAKEIRQGSYQYRRYLSSARTAVLDDLGIDESTFDKENMPFARFYDITIKDPDGNKIDPAAAVRVEISYDEEIENVEGAVCKAVHFGDKKTEVIDTTVDDTDGAAISFDAEGFSVYGVVYTVDFHWEVNGKTYDFSIPGGGYVSLQQLVEVLGIASANENSTDFEEAITLNELEVSEAAKKFVEDVESVEFSNPELIDVGKVESKATVGEIKENRGLNCEYSEELTEEQIAEINAQTVEAGDWALISLQPFTSEETLTVTMKNHEVFAIQMTDALHVNPDELVGKEIVIYDKTENRALTSNWEQNKYRSQFNSIEYGGEGTATPNNAHWTVEKTDSNYYLKSHDGKYLKIDNNNVSLVGTRNEATSLTIQVGGNPDYRIYAKNDASKILTYSENYTFDGLFCAPGGSAGTGTTRTWLGIDYAVSAAEPAGDWMLYFDDDFDEITIHVGETITLRPYDKWTWKESDIQSAHWNLGGVSDWTIGENDANGSKKTSWNDGVFAWTRYVKYDDQLVMRYWSVQGRATATGDYTLTNSKNGRTITVHVVDGDPVNKPGTIQNTADIKVNLFDYDKYYKLDPANNTNLANNNNNKNDSTNKMGGDNHFYFLSSGSGNNNNENWNSYTKDRANPGIVKNQLDSEGYPVLTTKGTSLKYLFDTSKTDWTGGSDFSNPDGMIAYPNVNGMFRKDNNGFYYYNSNVNYFYYNTETGTSYLYEHTYTQASGKEKGSLVNDKPIGFFPFHDYDSTSDLYVNQNSNLNHHVGLSMDIDFILPDGKLDEHGNKFEFDFSGDDDLWVFLEWTDDKGVKQSKLMLDLGGIHQPITGSINFTDDSSVKANMPYRLKVFYLERGGCDSNCSIRFNLPVEKELSLEKKLTGLTDSEREKYKNEVFTYEVFVNNELYNGSNTIRKDANGNIIERGFTITNGQVTIKDGETVTITGLARTDTFYAAEEKSLNMERFEAPHAERYYQSDTDGTKREEEITLTESQTQGAATVTKDWKTPTYNLQDTERVTFTNTLKEKDLEVDKKWEGEGTHPDQVKFTVSASVEVNDGLVQEYPVSVLKDADGTTDKEFTLSGDNNWRTVIEHLPVQTPGGKLIVYNIKEVHVDGYVSNTKDLTAENYNYCNVDAVKLWPDDQHNDEVITVKLRNKAGQFYAGIDEQGNAKFDETGQSFELTKDNNYTHRFARLPYNDTYKVVQIGDQDNNTQGLVTYVRNIIQYQLTNTPIGQQVDPSTKDNPEIHKRIDALRDGKANPDSPHTGEELTDLYRLYLDYKINSLQEANGIDLLFVIDHSGSMNNDEYSGNQFRAPTVKTVLNGEEGFIADFLKMNSNNRWAAVEFSGPSGFNYRRPIMFPPFYVETDFRSPNAGETDSEIIENWGDGVGNIELENNGATMLTDYTAGLWRAEQFLFDNDILNDGKKKVIIFISDGIPTLYIDCKETLTGADTMSGSAYYPDPEGCPEQTLEQVANFKNDIVNKANDEGEKIYKFGENIEFYTIGFGDTMKTEYGSALLKNMLKLLYGDDDHEGNFMTISDTSNRLWESGYGDMSAASNKLKDDLCTIMGMNETFSNIVIQDDLSKYVDLIASDGEDNILKSANAKVTMTDPDDPTKVVVLWENGSVSNSEKAKFTKTNGEQASIINGLEYDALTKTVKAVFDPAYEAKAGITYTLSFDVKTTDEAYSTYANSGYDKYTDGEHSGEVIKGDSDTDFKGTDPANTTSSGKEGFRSNDTAKATYEHNNQNEEKEYPHPVIQVFNAPIQLLKTDQSGNPLAGAKFSLYKNAYDASGTAEAAAANTANLVKGNMQSTIKGDAPNQVAEISVVKLKPGTYYLVETDPPAGYNSIDPIKIEVSVNTVVKDGVTTDTVSVKATQGTNTLVNFLTKPTEDNDQWILKVQNNAGIELPSTGGPGTRIFKILGSILILGAGVLLWRRRRLV